MILVSRKQRVLYMFEALKFHDNFVLQIPARAVEKVGDIWQPIMDTSTIDDSVLMPEPTLPIVLTPSVFRPFAYRILSKKYGLNVQSSALEKLASYVGRRFGVRWKKDYKTSAFLDALAKLWKEQGRGIFVDGEGVSQIIKELMANEKRNKKNIPADTIDDSIDTSENFEDNNDSSILLDTSINDTSDVTSSQILESSDISITQQNNPGKMVDWSLFFKVVDPNHYTCFIYDRRRKQFEYKPLSMKKMKMIQLPSTDEVLSYYISRLDILRDRLYRNNVFSKLNYNDLNQPKSQNQTKQPQYITYVKNLLGRNEERFALFGLVTLNSYGLWQLQDETDKIELVLNQCLFAEDSFFVSGNYLIVDGFYSSVGRFHVLSIQQPPAETRSLSLDALVYLDFNWDFSKNGKIDTTMKQLTQKQIKSHTDHKIVVLGGNLYLDDLNVMAKLKKTLQVIENELQSKLNNEEFVTDRPISIVFNGPFISKAVTVTEGSSVTHITSTSIYKTGFDNLAYILEKLPTICQSCKLIFVPGNEDPWLSMITKNSNSIWPQMKIPQIFGTRLRRIAQDLVWATNPCRINYLSQDIAIMRDDIGETFKRNDFSYLCELSKEEIDNAMRHTKNVNTNESFLSNTQQQLQNLEIDRLTTKENPDMTFFRKVTKTLLDQGILSPFTSNVRPILTNYWPLLTLLPLPDVLIISDATSPRLATMYKGCLVANAGSFYENGCANYTEYYPSSKIAKFRTVY